MRIEWLLAGLETSVRISDEVNTGAVRNGGSRRVDLSVEVYEQTVHFWSDHEDPTVLQLYQKTHVVDIVVLRKECRILIIDKCSLADQIKRSI